jgi:hypothetical protein
MDISGTTVILFSVLIVALGAVVFLTLSSKTNTRLNRERYQAKWLAIEHSLKRDNPASYTLAVMNADKLLDQALKESRYRGKTMGERLKSAQSIWKHADYVWGAHKIRNRLAHESDYEISYEIAARSLAAFKQALKDVGAI